MRIRAIVLAIIIAGCGFADAPFTTTRLEFQNGLEENRGQARADIRFILRPGLYVSETAFTFADEQIRIQFEGGNAAAAVSTLDTLAGVVNVVSGNNAAKWVRGIRQFKEVRFASVYPGIGVQYRVLEGGGLQGLRLRWYIAPGADPAAIVLRCTGAVPEDWTSEVLRLRAIGVRVAKHLPITAFQEGVSRIAVGWRVGESNDIWIDARYYDRAKPLIIETSLPVEENGLRSANPHVSSSGEFYIVGDIGDLVTEEVPADTRPAGGLCSEPGRFAEPCTDAYVAKYSASGTLEYITYITGTTRDGSVQVNTDRAGDVWVLGQTDSYDFPVTPDASQPRFAGPDAQTYSPTPGGDMFLMKLDGASGLPVYSTFHGGPDDEAIDSNRAFLIDALGNIYVAGLGTAWLPVNPRALFTDKCELCSYAAKWTNDGRFVYGTYLPRGTIAYDVDAAGSLYFAGSAEAGFPVTPGAYDTTFNGGERDAFVAKLNATGTALVYGSFFGGSGNECIQTIAVDSKGNAWFDGSAFEGRSFLGKLDPAGSKLLVSLDSTGAHALKVDDQDNVYLFSSQDFGRHTVGNPGGALTTRCGYSTFAKLDEQGVLIYLEASGKYQRFVGLTHDGKLALVREEGSLGTEYRLYDAFYLPERWLGCSLDAAGQNLPNTVAPGEIITLLGSGLGPAAGASFVFENGRVPRMLGGTRVLFDGEAAPVLFAQNAQVNAIAPFALRVGSTVKIEVEYNGARAERAVKVTDSQPQMFTQDGSGSGLVAALNQDGTLNREENPAHYGSVVSFFLTGTGQPEPAVREGEIAQGAGVMTRTQFRILLGCGHPDATALQLQYVGFAPGLLNSVTQVNARLPDTLDVPPIGTTPEVSLCVFEDGYNVDMQYVRLSVR